MRLLNDFGFEVMEIEDIELFEDRCRAFPVSADVLEHASRLTPEEPMALGTVHAYKAG